MPEPLLSRRLELLPLQQQGQYTLLADTASYAVTVRPEASADMSDWLYRLPALLQGQRDDRHQPELLHHVGTWLWRALLPESAPAQQREALAHALRTEHVPLLLNLPDMLAVLPWELLCDPEQPADSGFLARHRPLLRAPASDNALPAMAAPLRVLVLIASPLDLGEDSRVDVESERAAIEQATYPTREQGTLHLRVEDLVTPERVQRALIEFAPHIVHFIGHGSYDAATGGALLWEDEQGRSLPMVGTRLAELLGARQMAAVVLHACQTGRSERGMQVRGIAATLVQAGIPIVLAQQANFSYESSQRASRAWYRALSVGRSGAEALVEVRQALALADRPDWAVPIAYANAACLFPFVSSTPSSATPDPLLSSTLDADLPAPTGVFVGRHRELRALRLMLEQAPGTGPVLALLTGPGGIGKSALVSQAILRYGRGYKAVLTLRCEGYQHLDLFLERIGTFLKRQDAPGFLEQVLPDPKLSIAAKIEEAVTALQQAGPLLLVVDTLESVQQPDHTLRDPSLLALLQKLLTNLRRGRVLITGRYTVKDLLPQGKFAAHVLRLDLDDLSRYETTQLLTRHPSLAQTGASVQLRLLDEFGGLPFVYDLLANAADSQSLDLLVHDVQGRVTQERRARTDQEWQEVRQQVIEFAALETTVGSLALSERTLLMQLSVVERAFPREAMEQGLGATRTTWQPLLDRALLRYDALNHVYHLHTITRHYAATLLEAEPRQEIQRQVARWYERYAKQDTHYLADYLEAHRLLRAAGDLQEAGRLVLDLVGTLRRFGLYPLVRDLCTKTLNDLRERDEPLAASALRELGIIAQQQGEYEQARGLYQYSLEIFERLDDQLGRAATLHQLGVLAQDQGEYEQAYAFYQQSLEIKQRLGDQAGRATTLHQLGVLAQQQGEYEQARGLYQQSLEIEERLGNQAERANALHQLGNIAYLQGEYEQAYDLYQQSLKIAERLSDLAGRANALHQLGMIAQDQGEYEQARGLYHQSLEIAEQLGDQAGRAGTLHQLGNIAYLQGEYEQARSLYQQSLEIKQRLGDQAGRATTLHQLGTLAQQQGEYEQARGLYQQSLEITKRLGNQAERASTLHQLGTLAHAQGEYEQARSLYQQSLEIAERLGDQDGQATSLHQLGMIAQHQGDYEQAYGLYQQSLEIKQRLGDQAGRATSLHQLGALAQRQGDYEQAYGLYQQSLEIKQRLGDQAGRANSLGKLGMVAFQQGDLEHAVAYTVQAFLIFDVLRSPARAQAQEMIARIRNQMDEATFLTLWHKYADNAPVPTLSDGESFIATVNRLCIEAVTALRTRHVEVQGELAAQLEQMLKGDLPLPGAPAFLQLLIAWLRGQETQSLLGHLQPPFNDVYTQMVADVERKEKKESEQGEALTMEQLLAVVSELLMQGTAEARQQFATRLTLAQQLLPPEQAALGRLFGCLVAALWGDVPEVVALEPPFTELWHTFQAGLDAAASERTQQKEEGEG